MQKLKKGINSIEITENNHRKEKCKKKLKLQNLKRILTACISIVTRKIILCEKSEKIPVLFTINFWKVWKQHWDVFPKSSRS